MTERGAIRAVIFDFDGLIIDTETPIFAAWQEEFERHGAEISHDDWMAQIGSDGSAVDPLALLVQRCDGAVDVAEVAARRRARTMELLSHETVQPGVIEWLDTAADLGLGLAVASSSTREWVAHHLHVTGLSGRFRLLCCFGRGLAAKPAPDLYAAAVRSLGVRPHEALALEDSPNGLAAARAAGLSTVAVPNPVTGAMDLGHADLTVPSLAEVSLPDAVHRLGRIPVPADRDTIVVLPEYMDDGRLTSLPSKWSKRRLVLDAVVQEIDPGERLTEIEINDRLRVWSDDVALLRRQLVDEELLARSDGTYWRIGGTVGTAP